MSRLPPAVRVRPREQVRLLKTHLDPVWNVQLGIHQEIARDTDDALVGATSGRGRQFRFDRLRYVNPYHGEVAVRQLPDVGAIAQRNRLPAVCVRVGADPAQKFEVRVHPSQQSGNRRGNARTKYSAYTVVRICGFGFPCRVVKIPKYRKVLGENIRTRRLLLKWSQEKLAEKSDLHPNYIGDIERGEENVSVDALKRVATALKVRLCDLVRGV